MSKSRFGAIKQLGYLVDDIDAGTKAWTESLGIGPWTILRNVTLEATYLGKPTSPKLNVALSYDVEAGIQIELIQQLNDAPSPYIEFFKAGRLGLHHTAYLIDDIDAAEQEALAHGMELVFDIRQMDMSRYLYFRQPGLGNEVYVEFLQNTDAMQGMFSGGMEAAKSWSGNYEVTTIDLG